MSDSGETATTGKGRATPKRNQARAARATERKAPTQDRKAQAAARRLAAQEARAAMNQTDASKLPANERVPELIFTRDLVDSRFYVGQALVWVMLAVVLLSFIPALAQAVTYLGFASFIVIVVMTTFDSRTIKRRVAERFPDSNVRVRAYAVRRLFAPRRMRKPVPRVARGATIS